VWPGSSAAEDLSFSLIVSKGANLHLEAKVNGTHSRGGRPIVSANLTSCFFSTTVKHTNKHFMRSAVFASVRVFDFTFPRIARLSQRASATVGSQDSAVFSTTSADNRKAGNSLFLSFSFSLYTYIHIYIYIYISFSLPLSLFLSNSLSLSLSLSLSQNPSRAPGPKGLPT
jgi:hypothetical protein